MRVTFHKYFTKLKSLFARMNEKTDLNDKTLEISKDLQIKARMNEKTDLNDKTLEISKDLQTKINSSSPTKITPEKIQTNILLPNTDKSFAEKYSINTFTFENFYFQNKKYYLGNKQFLPIYDTPLKNINPHIYICERCITVRNDKKSFTRHLLKCTNSTAINTCISGRRKSKQLNFTFYNQFGVLIYEEKALKVYRVDGEIERSFCQNLCALGKCFLEDKTLFYDVEMFEFFVLFKNDCLVGYFSRQKHSIKTNLSCIVVLPFYQKQGFGIFLVDFSYKIQRGSPERPLSESGLAVYIKYWKYKVYQELLRSKYLSIWDISKSTEICVDDVVYGLELLGVLKKNYAKIIECPKYDFVPKLMCKKEFFIE